MFPIGAFQPPGHHFLRQLNSQMARHFLDPNSCTTTSKPIEWAAWQPLPEAGRGRGGGTSFHPPPLTNGLESNKPTTTHPIATKWQCLSVQPFLMNHTVHVPLPFPADCGKKNTQFFFNVFRKTKVRLHTTHVMRKRRIF